MVTFPGRSIVAFTDRPARESEETTTSVIGYESQLVLVPDIQVLEGKWRVVVVSYRLIRKEPLEEKDPASPRRDHPELCRRQSPNGLLIALLSGLCALERC